MNSGRRRCHAESMGMPSRIQLRREGSARSSEPLPYKGLVVALAGEILDGNGRTEKTNGLAARGILPPQH
jgi:hypothetical protein